MVWFSRRLFRLAIAAPSRSQRRWPFHVQRYPVQRYPVQRYPVQRYPVQRYPVHVCRRPVALARGQNGRVAKRIGPAGAAELTATTNR